MTEVITVGISLVTIILILAGAALVLGDFAIETNNYACCGNKTCSDTYYDSDMHACVLTMCLHNPLITNKTTCTYEPKYNLTGWNQW